MKIEIKRSYIYDEVSKLCAYIGAKSGDYERVGITGDDTLLFEQWWSDACGDVVTLMRRWITGFSPLADHHDYTECRTLEVELDAPHLGIVARDRIVSAATGYMVNRIASRWLAVTSPENAGKYADIAAKSMTDMNNIIYYRKKIRYEEY